MQSCRCGKNLKKKQQQNKIKKERKTVKKS